MFKNKAVAIVSLSLLLITSSFLNSTISMNVFAVDTIVEEGQITEAYEYPIVPGMDEWKQLDTHVKKVNACQIPEDILDKLTTEALVETVMNYPLLIDMLAYNTQYTGYQAVYNEFNGLRELQTREDAAEYLENYQGEVSLLSVVAKIILLATLF